MNVHCKLDDAFTFDILDDSRKVVFHVDCISLISAGLARVARDENQLVCIENIAIQHVSSRCCPETELQNVSRLVQVSLKKDEVMDAFGLRPMNHSLVNGGMALA